MEKPRYVCRKNYLHKHMDKDKPRKYTWAMEIK